MKRILVILILNTFAVLLLGADRFLKTLMLKNPSLAGDFFIEPFLQLQFYKNTGVAFSIPVPQTLSIIISGLIIALLIFILIKHSFQKKILLPFFYTLIVLGAMSNLFDRIFYGFVIDYLNIIFYWWVFNIADFMISVGIIGLIITTLHEKK